MSNETLFLIFTIFLVIISLPTWGYSKSWGYKPTGVLTAMLVLFVVWAIIAGRPLFRHSVAQDIRTTGHDMMN